MVTLVIPDCIKSPEEIVAYVARRIGYMYYHRPIMYGGNAEGVDLLLYTYHEFWSEIVGRFDEFREVYWKVGEEEDCGAATFSTRYSMDHPDASDDDNVRYTVAQWRKVSDRLDVPIPRAELAIEFEVTGDGD
jgi:hypothetical protein